MEKLKRGKRKAETTDSGYTETTAKKSKFGSPKQPLSQPQHVEKKKEVQNISKAHTNTSRQANGRQLAKNKHKKHFPLSKEMQLFCNNIRNKAKRRNLPVCWWYLEMYDDSDDDEIANSINYNSSTDSKVVHSRSP